MNLKKADRELFEEAVALLRKHIKYALTVPQLADRLHVSERSLQRIFQEACRESVYAYFRRMKIEHAQQLLLTGHTIKQATVASGYRTESAFVQAFKGITTNTPREWLKKKAA